MIAIVKPNKVNGSVKVPASKSAMQRACAAALIRKGVSVLHNRGRSEDDAAAIDIIGRMGARVTMFEDRVEVYSEGMANIEGKIHCGESGLSMRMFTSIAACTEKEIVIEGRGSLLKRPVGFFDDVLPQLGVSVASTDGHLPLNIKGPLQPKNITVDGSLSSQFLTGLLFAFAAQKAEGVNIKVIDLNSKPYIDLTLQVMEAFGLPIPQNLGYKEFRFERANGRNLPDELHYNVEGDWSGAAFLLVAGAIAGEVEILGLDVFSTQADKAVLQALMQAGAPLSIEAERIIVKKAGLKAFHFDATQCPDLFPPLAVLAAYCEGRSVIEGVSRLKHKESDRAKTIQEELGRMGVEIQLQDDLMIVTGGQPIIAANVRAHHDHRIAMACAIAALGASGPVSVEEAESVAKSYPEFWAHLQQLGIELRLES